jgi:PhnB protein
VSRGRTHDASGDDARVVARDVTPMLTVKDAGRAISYYEAAFGAAEVSRFTSPDGVIVAELAIDDHRFWVVDENRTAFNLSPDSLGGTSVRMNLIVDDPDTAVDRAVEAGGRVVFPVGDQPYGLRQGRIADPFGHHWLIGAPIRA